MDSYNDTIHLYAERFRSRRKNIPKQDNTGKYCKTRFTPRKEEGHIWYVQGGKLIWN